MKQRAVDLGLLGQHVFRDVGLGAAGRITMDDARLDGFVHRGGIGGAGGLGGGSVLGDHGGIELLAEGLDGGLNATVTGREARGLAGGFDSRFGVGHGRWRDLSRPKTQTPAGESRVLSER